MKSPHHFSLLTSLTALCLIPLPLYAKDTLNKIEHIVVIYGENRSFDHLYGMFPNANGIKNAKPEQYVQLDTNGKILPYLPPIWKERSKELTVDPQFNFGKLPNKPFRLDAPPFNLSLTQESRDLVHRFYQNQEQINGGKNNRFAAVSDAGGLTMGYYDGSKMKLWQYAKDYTLADNFFMGTFGGSFMNHIYLACACIARFPNAPSTKIAVVNHDGKTLTRVENSPSSALDGYPKYLNDGAVSPDGYGINTLQPPYQPSGMTPADNPAFADNTKAPLPPQSQTTIGDLLSNKHISWTWYAGAWNAATADGMQAPSEKRKIIYNEDKDSPDFQPHHQPYNYFVNYAPGTTARAEHLKDGSDFEHDIVTGHLPAVSFYKPQGNLNEHPGYADVAQGDEHIAKIIHSIQDSPQWNSTLIIVTYDENGGFWDHVMPPKGDRWGPGTRVPTLLISPWVKKHHVDHHQYDTGSILQFISKRFKLEHLVGVRTNMGDLTKALLD